MQKNYLLLLLVAGPLLFSGCNKSEEPEPEPTPPQPGNARVTLITDWSNLGVGVDRPDTYTISATGVEEEGTAGSSYTLEKLFGAGSYEFLLYNKVEEVPVTDGVAKVRSVANPTETAGSPFIEPFPGWLFTGTAKADLKEGEEYELKVSMQQQVREFTLMLEVEGSGAKNVTAIEGYLTGAAGELNISNNTHANPSNIALTFTKTADGEEAGKWSATVRMLGIAGEEQKLIGRVSLAGEEEGIAIEVNLTEDISGFNDDKKEPLTWMSSLTIVTPTEPEPDPQIKVLIVSDWSDRGEDVEIPSIYTISTTGTEETASGESHSMETLFDPGSYSFYLYNYVPEIPVTAGRAKVNTVTPPKGTHGTFIHSTPGQLFTGFTEAILDTEPEYELKVTMHQQVRRLTFTLQLEGNAAKNVAAIEGYLTGVASELDMRHHTHNQPSNVALNFTKITTGTDAGKWSATVWLLGVTGNEQKLVSKISLLGGTATTTLTSDLKKEFSGFNDDKINPLELTGSLTINTTDPDPGPDPGPGPNPDPGPDPNPDPGVTPEFTASINGWRARGSGTGSAQ